MTLNQRTTELKQVTQIPTIHVVHYRSDLLAIPETFDEVDHFGMLARLANQDLVGDAMQLEVFEYTDVS